MKKVIIKQPTTIEKPSSFLCSKRDCPQLIAKFKIEADKLLEEFKAFYSGNFGYEVYAKEYPMGYSISANLLVNGEIAKAYDIADIMLLDINELILKQMIARGIQP